MALNLKGIEHKTEWVEHVDIQKRMAELGMPPIQTLEDGTPYYAIPAIHDSSTNAKVSDSYEIIKYLDETYPNTPKVLVEDETGSNFLQPALRKDWDLAEELLQRTAVLLAGIAFAHMPEVSREKYRGRYETRFKINVEEYMKDEQAYEAYWKEAQETYSKAAAWIAEAEKVSNSPWIVGKTPTWPDIVIAANTVCLFISAVGEDGKEWKRVSQWDGGRWGRFWNGIKPFTTVH